MMNKIITKISLLILVLFLSGCGENPMLDPKMMLALESEVTQNSSLKDRVLCVEYGTNPSAFSLRQPYCSNWMQNQYKGFVGKVTAQIATASIDSTNSNQTIPTFENFIDPKVWQILWSQDGEQWKQALAAQKTVPVPAPINAPIIKNKTAVHKPVHPAQRIPVCELYPRSLACERIKRAIIRNAIYQ